MASPAPDAPAPPCTPVRQDAASPTPPSDLESSWMPVALPTSDVTAAVRRLEAVIQQQQTTQLHDIQEAQAELAQQVRGLGQELQGLRRDVQQWSHRVDVLMRTNKEVLRQSRQQGILSRAQLPVQQQHQADTIQHRREMNLALRRRIPVPFMPSTNSSV